MCVFTFHSVHDDEDAALEKAFNPHQERQEPKRSRFDQVSDFHTHLHTTICVLNPLKLLLYTFFHHFHNETFPLGQRNRFSFSPPKK